MKHFFSEIFEIKQISNSFFSLDFFWPNELAVFPGQFVTIRIQQSCEPFLRRPFAFASVCKENKRASIIFKVVGKGTELLSLMKKGQKLDLLGPLGNSFPLPPITAKPVLIAGGIGFGPVFFLYAELLAQHKKPIFIAGFKTKQSIPSFLFDYPAAIITTDDGSAGIKGDVTYGLRELQNTIPSDSLLYACGPSAMLHSCHQFCTEQSKTLYISAEEMMACGVGVCCGCAVKTKNNEYKLCCKEGPVFNSKDVIWI